MMIRIPLGLSVLLVGLVLVGCSPRNVELLAVNAPEKLETNESGTFEAVTNEDAKPPVSFSWDLGDGGASDVATMTHAYAEAGTYSVTVTVSNRKGKATASGSATVEVVNPPVPAQLAALLADRYETDTQTAVGFSANVRGDAPISYAWDFGDGSSSTVPAPLYTWSEAGEYMVTLTISNAYGSDTRTVGILVVPFEAEYCAELAEMNAVFFERNTSVLSSDQKAVLSDNLQILADCPNLHVRVEGLAGPFERRPEDLSTDRARAVEQHYLVNGVDASRITTVGIGQVGRGSKKSGSEQYHRADTVPVH